MNAQSARKIFTPEEKASYRGWLFGSTLDWSTRILVEINYPIEELRWFIDGVQGLCKGKAMRISHSTLAKRAQRFKNKSQARELAKRAIEADREWARLKLCMVFDIESPKPTEREGKDKRARTLYTDYLTAAAVWAQEAEHRIKKADELKWKRDVKYRVAKQREVLAEAIKMLPSFGQVEDMPESAKPKPKAPLTISEYVEQREKILLAENNRILDRLAEGELIDAEEIDARLATLEVSHEKVVHTIEKTYQSTRDVLIGLKKTRLQRAVNMGDVDAEEDEQTDSRTSSADAPEAPQKGNAGIPPIENGELGFKGNAGIPLSDPPDQAKEESESAPQKGNVHIPPSGSNSSLTQLDCALNYVALGVPVFPTKPDKKPYTQHGFKDASKDPAQIRSWWRDWPEAGIGIPTGKASGWMVLDVDPDKGGDASLSALIEQHGDLPPTSHVKTPRRGDHFYFKNPTAVEVRNSESKIGKGLDIRGEGGYVVVPGRDPSRRWTNVLDANDAPPWLIEAATSKKHEPVDTDRQTAHYPFTGGRFFSEGERNSGLRDVACGRWIHGYAVDAQDLYEQLRHARDTRCAAGKDSPATDAQLLDMAIRTTQKYSQGGLRRPVESVTEDYEEIF